uniref:C-type mannose receptor 2-like n=1 Tax=Fundulus heteroclitus TaxID=8078 RepID=A0A3Q2Q7L0_FUNHE
TQQIYFFFAPTGQCSAVVCQLYEYHYINVNKTWTEAQQYCRENHTDLATVSNMTDMKRLLSNSAGDMREAWIGLYDQTGGTRTWRWSLPGVEFNKSYQPWSTNEPNDAGGMQNCGIIWKTLKWGDLWCNDPRYFLCYNGKNICKNWTEAQSYCRKEHTDLISGLTQLQDEEVKTECSSVADYTYIFTGLFRDTWRWSDGSSFSFRHWNLQFNNQIINSDKLILIKENKTWEEALYYCRNHHHDLVTITNLEEQRWVQEKAKKASTPFVWTGLHYNCLKNFWFWVCKEHPVSNTSQASGQMTDCDTSGAMETGGQHRWFQGNDKEELNFICSKF